MTLINREHRVDDHGRHIRSINYSSEGINTTAMSVKTGSDWHSHDSAFKIKVCKCLQLIVVIISWQEIVM